MLLLSPSWFIGRLCRMLAEGNPGMPHHALELKDVWHRRPSKLFSDNGALLSTLNTQEITGYFDARLHVADLEELQR